MKRLLLRWLLLGWWAVPLLVTLFLLSVLLDAGGWFDENGDVHYDPDLMALSTWCLDRLTPFFHQ